MCLLRYARLKTELADPLTKTSALTNTAWALNRVCLLNTCRMDQVSLYRRRYSQSYKGVATLGLGVLTGPNYIVEVVSDCTPVLSARFVSLFSPRNWKGVCSVKSSHRAEFEDTNIDLM